MRKEIREIVCGVVASVLLTSVVIAVYLLATITYINNPEDIGKYLGYHISNDSMVKINYSYVKSEESNAFTDITVYAKLSDYEMNDFYFNDSFDSTVPNKTEIDDDCILSRGHRVLDADIKGFGCVPDYTVYWYRVNDESQYNVIFHTTLTFKAFFSKNIAS